MLQNSTRLFWRPLCVSKQNVKQFPVMEVFRKLESFYRAKHVAYIRNAGFL